MSSSTAHFRDNVLVEGDISGPTVLRIDSEKIQLLNSLNQHSDFQAEQTATQQEIDSISQALAQAQADTISSITSLTQQVDDNKADIEGKLAIETNARLALASDMNNRNSHVDDVLTNLENEHTSDDARLTQVETNLKNVDTTI